MDKLAFPLELKSVAEDGTFEGYASTFGERDLGGDIVEPGAFTKTIKARGPKGVKMLADHDPRERIGVWTDLLEDSKGLYVKGRLLTEKSNGREALIDLKAGALDAMSIGFRSKSDSYDGRRRARLLKEVDLLEISLVPFPMNEGARVTAVKSVQDMDAEDWREIEATLRMKGLSRTDAVKAVSGFKEWLRRDAGEPETSPRDEDGAALADALRRNIALIAPKG